MKFIIIGLLSCCAFGLKETHQGEFIWKALRTLISLRKSICFQLNAGIGFVDIENKILPFNFIYYVIPNVQN